MKPTPPLRPLLMFWQPPPSLSGDNRPSPQVCGGTVSRGVEQPRAAGCRVYVRTCTCVRAQSYVCAARRLHTS
jgi:hypothetical protein